MRLKKDLLFFLLILSVGIGINIGQFQHIEESVRINYNALNRSFSGDIVEVATSESITPRGYYSAWVTLAEVAPHSTIHPAKDTFASNLSIQKKLKAFGNITRLESSKNIPDDLLSNLDVESHVVASGERTRDDLPYFAIAINTPKPVERERRSQYGLYVSKDTPIKEGVDFLLVPWSGPNKAFHRDMDISDLNKRDAPYYILLLDIELLDVDTRNELGL